MHLRVPGQIRVRPRASGSPRPHREGGLGRELRSGARSSRPEFEKGGKYEKWAALYEAVDTALYKPSRVTGGASHVRDSIDLKRIMITVWLCTFPAMFAGMYAIGHNANEALAPCLPRPTAGAALLSARFAGFDPASAWDCLVHGVLLPTGLRGHLPSGGSGRSCLPQSGATR